MTKDWIISTHSEGAIDVRAHFEVALKNDNHCILDIEHME
jgi:hypothetical protein